MYIIIDIRMRARLNEACYVHKASMAYGLQWGGFANVLIVTYSAYRELKKTNL